jgi:hypothetical protein
MEKTCYCGHVLDEHEDTTLAPCTIEDCDCVAFELDEDASAE